jgi:hypothetical protein
MRPIKTETIIKKVPFRLKKEVVDQLRTRPAWDVIRLPWSCGAESHEGHFACYPLWDEPYLSQTFPDYVRLDGGYSEAWGWFQILAVSPRLGKLVPAWRRFTVRQIAYPEEWR